MSLILSPTLEWVINGRQMECDRQEPPYLSGRVTLRNDLGMSPDLECLYGYRVRYKITVTHRDRFDPGDKAVTLYDESTG
jgi:hypothetical protein